MDSKSVLGQGWILAPKFVTYLEYRCVKNLEEYLSTPEGQYKGVYDLKAKKLAIVPSGIEGERIHNWDLHEDILDDFWSTGWESNIVNLVTLEIDKKERIIGVGSLTGKIAPERLLIAYEVVKSILGGEWKFKFSQVKI